MKVARMAASSEAMGAVLADSGGGSRNAPSTRSTTVQMVSVSASQARK